MGGLAGLIRWDNNTVSFNNIKLMLDRISHRAPDGSTIDLATNIGFGHAYLNLSDHNKINSGIAWNLDKTIGIVADARIYNRTKLLKNLNYNQNCGDAELIFNSYIKWGHDLLDKLEGDFSFAIIDKTRDLIFAARDIVGAKPFFYSSSPDRFIFGSEPKQILGLPFGVTPQADQLEVARYLEDILIAGESTVWKSIKRLKPGHFLIATSNDVKQTPYWRPELLSSSHCTCYDKFIDTLRKKFIGSVSHRLNTDETVAIHVSGGYDSSSIALIAEEVTNLSSTSLIALSITHEEKEVDESEYIELIQKKLSYPMHLYQAPKLDSSVNLFEQAWNQDSPAINIETQRDEKGIKIMKKAKAKILLSGFGGDDVFWEPDYGKDLINIKDISKFITRLFECYQQTPYLCFKIKLREILAKKIPIALELYSQLKRGKINISNKSIISKDLQKLIASTNLDHNISESLHFDSYSQKQIYEWMTCSRLQWSIEHQEAFYAHHGIEVRYPYLDKNLMENILSIPLSIRLKNKNRMKPLLQDIMGNRLPKQILSRNNKASFDQYYLNLFDCWKEKLFLIVQSHDSSETDKLLSQSSNSLYYKIINNDSIRLWTDVRPFWAVATHSIWLQTFDKYMNGAKK